jgi:hypothetical protein
MELEGTVNPSGSGIVAAVVAVLRPNFGDVDDEIVVPVCATMMELMSEEARRWENQEIGKDER